MRLFISYAHADVAQVKTLVDILRTGGHDPWFDHKLLPGQDWQAELLAAITASDAFVYALTPESVASEWCQWEFARAVEMGKPVIPVLVRKTKEIPKEISRFQYADVSEGFTAFNIAQVMGGLTHIATFRVQSVPASPANPADTPAQAVGIRHVGSASLPPDLSQILPLPFEWCETPAGWVTLKDTSKYKNPGTKGGRFHIKQFWMAKYPITNAQYAVFENDDDGYLNPIWWDYSFHAKAWRAANPTPQNTAFPGHDLPRTEVCWYEAAAFCRWLTARTTLASSLQIMLPTETQWGRAAQGDDNRTYPWGDDFDMKRCNTDESKIGKPTPVNQYPNGVSPYNVIDMSGNVWEWCSTQWGSESHDLAGDHRRVLRGGSFRDLQSLARAAYRGYYRPVSRDNDIGFRVVCCPPSL